MMVTTHYWNCGQVRIKCNEDDTIGDLKKLIAAQTGTKYELFCISVFETGRKY